MKTKNTMSRLWSSPGAVLALGALLTSAAQLRWGVGVLAWIAPVPWLRYLRLQAGWRSRLWFVAVLVVAWTVAIGKIVTPPLPAAFAALGVLLGLVQAAGYLVWDRLRRGYSEGWAALLFAAVMTALELCQQRFSPLASWGAAAYTQLDALPLLQLAAYTGMAGVSFLVYFFAAALEVVLSAVPPLGAASKPLVFAVGAVLCANVLGVLRLSSPLAPGVTVAAIATSATFTGDKPWPDARERAAIDAQLLSDSERAARAGARLVVWTEGSALVLPEEEATFNERIAQLAQREHVEIAAAYIVPKREAPLFFENKSRWFRADGTLAHTYFKHHPAPGEPALVGQEPLPIVQTPWGRLSQALCYDYDYPQLAREHAAEGVDLVALPSSDWRGIDPLHTQMATLRAIETGASIVRSTRFGLSAGIDPLGRMRAWQSSFEAGQRVLVFDLPAHRLHTLYARTGDLFAYACAGFSLFAWLWQLAQHRRRAPHGAVLSS